MIPHTERSRAPGSNRGRVLGWALLAAGLLLLAVSLAGVVAPGEPVEVVTSRGVMGGRLGAASLLLLPPGAALLVAGGWMLHRQRHHPPS